MTCGVRGHVRRQLADQGLRELQVRGGDRERKPLGSPADRDCILQCDVDEVGLQHGAVLRRLFQQFGTGGKGGDHPKTVRLHELSVVLEQHLEWGLLLGGGAGRVREIRIGVQHTLHLLVDPLGALVEQVHGLAMAGVSADHPDIGLHPPEDDARGEDSMQPPLADRVDHEGAEVELDVGSSIPTNAGSLCVTGQNETGIGLDEEGVPLVTPVVGERAHHQVAGVLQVADQDLPQQGAVRVRLPNHRVALEEHNLVPSAAIKEPLQ
mmetsp:Transcript_54092/g.96259  ORF Transcript_54092/g.96259 Transcript_54092/m.96259 type:complete len:266 (-) Transcript_54092:1183-1980(-)